MKSQGGEIMANQLTLGSLQQRSLRQCIPPLCVIHGTARDGKRWHKNLQSHHQLRFLPQANHIWKLCCPSRLADYASPNEPMYMEQAGNGSPLWGWQLFWGTGHTDGRLFWLLWSLLMKIDYDWFVSEALCLKTRGVITAFQPNIGHCRPNLAQHQKWQTPILTLTSSKNQSKSIVHKPPRNPAADWHFHLEKLRFTHEFP